MEINSLWNAVGAAAALCSLPGTVELGVLTAGAMLGSAGPRASQTKAAGRIAVVIPAHDEQESIGACLDSLFLCEEISGLAEVFVIADNCTDQTAGIARARGATVLERHDLEKRGKGHALLYAFERLLEQDFGAFLVIDADARVERNLIRECVSAFAQGAGALQCPYLVSNPDQSDSTRLLDLALRGFNLVRPKGRNRFGLSAGILGNGFGVSRATLEKVPYLAHSVVEDLEYHLSLVDAGIRVEFLGSTTVYGAMPTGGRGRATQRARWEGGRLRILRDRGYWLLARVARGNWRFAESLLDLLLLPLAFHVLLLMAAVASSWSSARLAGTAGLGVLGVHLAVAMAYGSSWRRDLRALCQVPAYLGWKLLQLPRILETSARSAAWVRTARSTGQEAA